MSDFVKKKKKIKLSTKIDLNVVLVYLCLTRNWGYTN